MGGTQALLVERDHAQMDTTASLLPERGDGHVSGASYLPVSGAHGAEAAVILRAKTWG